MALTLDGTNGIVSSGSITTQSATGVIFSDSSNQVAAASPFSLKNRIINGDMVIDQRNNGASVATSSGFLVYSVDRWYGLYSQTSKFTMQQNAGSVTPPAGFTNYLGCTSTSAYTVGSSEIFYIRQSIEGFNIPDLAWGTASAKTITISFWVRSSLTGTFGGALQNSAANRSYPFSYTISSANTWEQKSITITGDTTGTWLTNNGVGVGVQFSLGAGTAASGTAGSWQAANLSSATGAVSVVGTNGATFYITGVQLERNTTATPFEYIPYGMELMLCQRYAWNWNYEPSNSYIRFPTGYAGSTTGGSFVLQFPVTMRIIPSYTYSGAQFMEIFITGGGATGTSMTIGGDGNTKSTCSLSCAFSAGSFSATATLGIRINNNNTWTGIFSAEL
jgi:hypothetical protein